MPEKARVFVAEDSERWSERIEEYLNSAGHVVLLKAASRAGALQLINERFPELDIQVAVLDANLSPSEVTGNDGKFLVDTIRNKYPHIKLVGMSAVKFPTKVDIDIQKINIGELAQAVTNL